MTLDDHNSYLKRLTVTFCMSAAVLILWHCRKSLLLKVPKERIDPTATLNNFGSWWENLLLEWLYTVEYLFLCTRRPLVHWVWLATPITMMSFTKEGRSSRWSTDPKSLPIRESRPFLSIWYRSPRSIKRELKVCCDRFEAHYSRVAAGERVNFVRQSRKEWSRADRSVMRPNQARLWNDGPPQD